MAAPSSVALVNAARRQCNCDATVLGATRTEYKYDNKTNRKIGVMYECHGQVSYQYRDTYTSYHGYFFEDHDEALVSIRFDCYMATPTTSNQRCC